MKFQLPQLANAKVVRLNLPLVHPFENANGRMTTKPVVLLRLTDVDGRVVWSEAPAFPVGVYDIDFDGSHRAAVEMGRWALAAARAGRGLSAMLWEGFLSILGASNPALADHWRAFPVREAIGVRAVVGGASLDEIQRSAVAFWDAGTRSLKIKIKPDHDLERLDAVRSAVPFAPLSVDANGSYAPHQQKALLALDQRDLTFIEQPFSPIHWEATADLQPHLKTPISLDESLRRPSDIGRAVACGIHRSLAIKPALMGGFESTLCAVVDGILAAQGCAEPRFWVGGLLETSVGRSYALAMAALPIFEPVAELVPPGFYLNEGPLALGFTLDREGRVPLILPPSSLQFAEWS